MHKIHIFRCYESLRRLRSPKRPQPPRGLRSCVGRMIGNLRDDSSGRPNRRSVHSTDEPSSDDPRPHLIRHGLLLPGQRDSKNDDGAADDLLLTHIEPRQNEAVVDEPDKECTEQRANDVASTAKETRSTQNHGSNG